MDATCTAPPRSVSDSAASGTHLTETEVAGYLDRGLSADELARVESHLDTCAPCRSAVADVSRMAAAYAEAGTPKAAVSGAGHVHRFAPRRSHTMAGLALAATLLIAVMLVRAPGDESDRVRTQHGTRLGPAITALAPPDGGLVARSDLRFAWEGTGAASYRFVLLDDSGAPVWVHDTEELEVSVPHSIELTPGESYFWRVDAVADGIAASSEARRFTLGP